MSKILAGLDEICKYANMSKPTFYKFIKLGMPAVIIEGRWWAHSENIDKFFQRITNVSMKNLELPEGVE